MLTDWIISAATSSPVILALAALAALAWAVGAFGSLPGISALIGPYAVLARPVAALALALASFLLGARMMDERADAKAARTDLAFAQAQLANQKATAEQAARLKADAEARAKSLEQKVSSYEELLSADPPAAACVIDGNDARRLRDIR